MKRNIILAIFGVLAIGITFLAVKGQEMQEIQTEIEVAASPEQVWKVLTEIDKWQEWSPIIQKSSGTTSVGETLEITMTGKEPGSTGPKYNPKIMELKQPNFFRWRAHMLAGFIFTNDKVFELQETPSGTKVVHKEVFGGLLAPLFCSHMEQGVPPMLNAMNKALKKIVEARNAS